MMKRPSLNLPTDQIAAFCQTWKVSEFSVFGSALREDFRPDSDIDVLIAFFPDAKWSLLDHVQMQHELEAILGRKVDLVSRRGVERSYNPIRRQAILDGAESVYVAR
jgi:predicted nucleotidyltransferase